MAEGASMTGGDRIEGPARYVAAQGEAELRRIRAIVERAQRLLDEGNLTDTDIAAMRRPAPYAWEKPELFAVDREAIVYQAIAEDGATGEGCDLYYHASLARSVNECRRHFAARVGPHLADSAEIVRGHTTDIPRADLFVSAELRRLFEQCVDPVRRLPVLLYDAHLHINAS